MNLLIISFALFDIYCGARLLAKTKAEALGSFYRSVALFIIVVGGLVLGTAAFKGLASYGHRSEQRHFEEEYSEHANHQLNCDHTCFKDPHSDTGGFLPHEMIGKGSHVKQAHEEFMQNKMHCCHQHSCCKPSEQNMLKCCDKEGCNMHKDSLHREH